MLFVEDLKKSRIFEQLNLTEWGVCPFEEVGELFSVRAKARIPQNAKTVIAVLFPYRFWNEAYHGNISKYAAVNDYHHVCLELLNKACAKLKDLYDQNEFIPFVDNSPIHEVKTAAKCGLGVIGKHSMLIHPKYGSFVFIGTIISDIESDAKAEDIKSCINCGICVKQCPTSAILDCGIDKTLCLSNVTQRKGELTKAEESFIQELGCIWGCDRCQDVCPMNREAAKTNIPQFTQDIVDKISSETVEELCKERAFGFRGPAVLLRNLKLIEDNK